MNASLSTETPIAFGILTAYTDEQADVRSRDDAANKGREAAEACLKTIGLLRRIRGDRAPESLLAGDLQR